MERIALGSESFFEVELTTENAQAAAMNLDPGGSTGGPTNVHPDSDQWLFVREGAGHAIVDGVEIALESDDLLHIAAGETHEIRAADSEPLRTLSFYVPPTY